MNGINNVLNNNRNECIMFDLNKIDHIFDTSSGTDSDSDSVNSYVARMGKNLNAWQALQPFETV